MPRKHGKHGPVRDRRMIKLEDTIYRLRSRSPNFGSDILADLAVGPNGSDMRVPPTLDALAWDMGFYTAVFHRMQEAVALGLHREPWEYTALRWYQRMRFETKYITPIREYWKQNFYFYCVPSPGILEKDLETGEMNLTATPIADEGEETEMIVNHSHLLVLCILPVNAADAKDRFGLTRQRLEQLAPQVGWLLIRMIQSHSIILLSEAEDRLANWVPYLPARTHQIISERMRGYLTA